MKRPFLSGEVKKVKRVLSILKECNIRNVLFYLTEGLPEKRYEKMLVRYYSLYCMISEIWIPDCMRETIISGFRQTGRKCGNPVYSFFGISEDPGTEHFWKERMGC